MKLAVKNIELGEVSGSWWFSSEESPRPGPGAKRLSRELSQIETPESSGAGWEELIDSAAQEWSGCCDQLSPDLIRKVASTLASGGDALAEIDQLPRSAQFLLHPACEEIRWMVWAHQAAQSLEEAAEEVIADAVAAQARLLSCARNDLSSLQERLEQFLPHWVSCLRRSRSEGRFQLAVHWVLDFCAHMDADFHEWRSLFESLQMALSRHLNQGIAHGLTLQLHQMIAGVPRFEFLGLLVRGSSRVKDLGELSGPRFIVVCAAELLLESRSSVAGSRLLRGVLQNPSALGKVSPTEFGRYAREILETFRPLCERSRLDLLERLLDRFRQAYAWRAGQSEFAGEWKQLAANASANLSEVLERYRKDRGAGREVQSVFEVAYEATLLTQNLAQAQSLFRVWFVSRYAVSEANGLWSQPKAVIKSFVSQLTRCEAPGLRVLREGIPVLETIPNILHDCSGLCQEDTSSESAGNGTLLAFILQAYRRQQLIAWVSRNLHVRGHEDLGALLQSGQEQLGQLDGSGSTRERWEQCAPLWERTKLASALWVSSDSIASEASQEVYRRVPDYARQASPESLAKCQRDFGALLRRIGWSVLSSGDSVEAVKDWWAEFVDSYLVHRHDSLFKASFEALLQAGSERLDSQGRSLLSAHLEPILLDGSSDSLSASSSALESSPEYRFPRGRDRELLAQGGRPLEFKGLPKGTPERNFWVETLGREWPVYLWRGALSSRTANELGQWLLGGGNRWDEVDKALQAWAKTFVSASQSVELDFSQAVLDFVRQHRAGAELRSGIKEIAKAASSGLNGEKQAQSKCERDVSFWLDSLGRCLMSYPSPLGLFEFRRYLVTHLAPYIPREPRNWRAIWLRLGAVKCSPYLAAVLGELASELSLAGDKLCDLGAFAANFVNKGEPVFSPVPDEEQQWRGLLSSLAALGLYAHLSEAQRRHLLLVLVESYPLSREADFAQKLERVSQLFQGGLSASMLEDLGAVVAIRNSLDQAKENRVEMERKKEEGLSSSFSGSSWGLTQAQKVAWLTDAEAGETERFALAPSSEPLLQAYGEKCARDLSWLYRRLQVDAESPGLARQTDAHSWYLHNVLPFAQSVPPEEHIRALEGLLSQPESLKVPSWVLADFWGSTLFHLRQLQVHGRTGLRFRSITVDDAEQSVPAWFCRDALDIEAARDYALKTADSDTHEISHAELETLRNLLGQEAGYFAETGLCSPRMGWSLQFLDYAQAERALICWLYQSDTLQEVPLLDRLRLVDYLQANIEFLRQLGLARELRSVASELAEELDSEAPERVNGLLFSLADSLISGPRPVAYFNFGRHLLESLSLGESVPNVWDTLMKASRARLSTQAFRVFGWWCRRLSSGHPALTETASFLSPDSRAHRARPWDLLLTSLLASRLAQEFNPKWHPTLRGFLARAFWDPANRESAFGQLESMTDWFRETFISLDLGPVLKEMDALKKGWEVLAGCQELRGEEQVVLGTLGEKLQEVKSVHPGTLFELLLSLGRLELCGDAPASRWRLAACLKLLPQEQALSIVQAVADERLQVALANVLGRYFAFTRQRELGRMWELLNRLGELETAWSHQPKKAKKSKLSDATCRRDLNWLRRRLLLDGWQGVANPPEGAFEWYRWEVVPYAGKTTVKQFQTAVAEVVSEMSEPEIYIEPVRRCAHEFQRNVELRLGRGGKGAEAWELFATPVLDLPTSGKPEKRRWWDRLSESFEGIVSAIKED